MSALQSNCNQRRSSAPVLVFLTEWAEEQRVKSFCVFPNFFAVSARLPTTSCLRDIGLPPLFWDVTQRRLAVSYRRFGTIYRSHHQGSSRLVVGCRHFGRTYWSRHQWRSSLTIEDGTDRLFLNFGNYLLMYAAWLPVRAKILLLASSYCFKCNFHYRLRPNLLCSLCTMYCAILS